MTVDVINDRFNGWLDRGAGILFPYSRDNSFALFRLFPDNDFDFSDIEDRKKLEEHLVGELFE